MFILTYLTRGVISLHNCHPEFSRMGLRIPVECCHIFPLSQCVHPEVSTWMDVFNEMYDMSFFSWTLQYCQADKIYRLWWWFRSHSWNDHTKNYRDRCPKLAALRKKPRHPKPCWSINTQIIVSVRLKCQRRTCTNSPVTMSPVTIPLSSSPLRRPKASGNGCGA